jgi:hypothetical protein
MVRYLFPNATDWEGIEFTGLTINTNGGDVNIRGESDNNEGILFRTNLSIDTSGGNIYMKGITENEAGIYFYSDTTINSGTGTVELIGLSEGAGGDYGIWFRAGYDHIITSSNTTSSAISLLGDGFHGLDFRGSSMKIHAIGDGGGITLTAKDTRYWAYTFYDDIEILAKSGPIKWLHQGDDPNYYASGINIWLGSKSGVSGLETSSSDITIETTWKSDGGAPYNPNILVGTNGSFSMKGLSGTGSFSNTVNTNEFTFNQNSTQLNSLIFGSLNNTSTIAVNSNLDINGPIAIYANDMTVSSNYDLDTSNSLNSNILLKAQGYVVLASGVDFTTNGGDIIIWSNAANISSGSTNNEIRIDGTNVFTSNDGKIIFAGGLDTNSDGIPDGYAYRGTEDAIRSVDLNNNVTLSSGAGDIIIRGRGGGVGVGFEGSGTTSITSTSGDIGIYAISTLNHSIWSASTQTVNIQTTNGAITFDGSTSAGRGVSFEGILNLTSSGSGNISISGASTNERGILFNNSTVISSVTGTINISGTSTPSWGLNVSSDFVINTASTATTAINIEGISTSSHGIVFQTSAANKNILIQSNSNNENTGDVILTSTSSSGGVHGFWLDYYGSGSKIQILSVNGDIKLVSENIETQGFYINTNLYLGQRANDTQVLSITPIATKSTGNVTLLSDGGMYSAGGSIHINTGDSSNVGGNVIIAADTDGDNSGYITFIGSLNINTFGGDITLGGGNNNGSSYAHGNTYNGNTYSGIRLNNAIVLNSSGNSSDTGGNISIKGKSSSTSYAGGTWGVGFYENSNNATINSGTGTIYIEGISQNTNNTWNRGFVADMATLSIISSNNSSDAIKIIGKNIAGTGTNYGQGISLLSNNHLIYANTTGGGISLEGAGLYTFTFYNETEVLAVSGDINITSLVTGQLYLSNPVYLGSRAGEGKINSSSSNINISTYTNNYDSYKPNLATSGTVTFQSVSGSTQMCGSSCTYGYLVLDWYNLNQNSHTMSGLVIGNINLTTGVYLNNLNQNVNGAITVYGSFIAADQNLTTTAVGADILLKGSGNITLAASKSVTANGGDVTLWSDTDGSGGGNINLADGSSITTSGGDILLGGGSGATAADGYADGGSSDYGAIVVGDLNSGAGDISIYGKSSSNDYIVGVQIASNTITTTSGTITIRGQSTIDSSNNGSDNAFGVEIINATIQSTSGDIDILGTVYGDNSTNAGNVFGFYMHETSTIQSTNGGAIDLTGTLDATNKVLGVVGGGMWIGTTRDSGSATGDVTISTTSNNITITANSNHNDTSGFWHGLAIITYDSDDVSITSTSGNISFIGTANPTTTGTEDTGVVFQAINSSNISVNTDGGTITFTGESGTHGDQDVTLRSHTSDGLVSIGDSNTGAIKFIGNEITFAQGSTKTYLETPALLTFEPYANSFDATTIINGTLSSGHLNGASSSLFEDVSIRNFATTGGLTIGKSTNTADVTLSSAISIAGPITIYGTDITVSGNINSSGGNGDVFLSARGVLTTGSGGNRTINSGSGDITFYAERIIFDGGSTYNTEITSTGVFTLAPYDLSSYGYSQYGQQIEFEGTINGSGYFDATATDIDGLNFTNFNALTGLNLGRSGGTYDEGSGANSSNVGNNDWIRIDGSGNFSINGPINIYGDRVTVDQLITAAGDVNIFAKLQQASVAAGNRYVFAETANGTVHFICHSR